MRGMHRPPFAALPLAVSLALASASACVEDPLFPEDVEQRFTEVRDCRLSVEHELRYIRIFADELAHDPYEQRDVLFPAGATVVKAEYEDDGCTERHGYTAMQKLPAGEDPGALDWVWQATDPERLVLKGADIEGCVRCHEHCTGEGGHDGVCADP